MVQFYFLSIIFNVFAGLILASELLQERFEGYRRIGEALQGNTLRLITGIAVGVFGVFKILSAFEGDVPVVGDLIPAAAGIVMAITLLIDRFKERGTVSSQTVEALDRVFVRRKSIIGIIGIVVAVVHFFIPSVLFL
jgi:purine-cytosine permease-like protein